MRVAFQGETGAYSEAAVVALCPDAEPVGYASFEGVFEAVQNCDVSYGVVPIENSLHGSVHQNYDNLREFPLVITGEIQLRIQHLLLGVKGSTIEQIRAVYSHPQALGQCRHFLKKMLPDADVFAAYDTAGAAKMISTQNDLGHAAIASIRAAQEYKLEILAENIESNHDNYTRFLKLCTAERAKDDSAASASDINNIKTSVVYAQHENLPGSLFKSLAVFALRDIDLLKIESRPLVGSPGKYLFYLDLGGSILDQSVINALRHLDEVADSVKVLGSYPTGRKVE